MAYKVYLVELGNSVGDAAVSKQVVTNLKTYFDQVVKEYDAKYVGKGVALASADVVWTTSLSSVSGTELVIYFVRSSSDSVVQHMAGFGKSSGNSDGLTYPVGGGSPVGSEVYTAFARGNSSMAGALAALAFHEAMHNKLRWGDAKLHALNSKGTGLSSSPVDAAFKLTAVESDAMAKHLADSVAQWTNGINAWNDPLNGHL